MHFLASDLVWYQISLTYAIVQKKVSFSIMNVLEVKYTSVSKLAMLHNWKETEICECTD